MDLLQLMQNRRSIRSFADAPVPPEALGHILQAAALAPTSRNRKPCTFHPVTDRASLQKLSAAKQAGAAFTADAGAAIVVSADSNKADTWVEDSAIAMTYMMLAAEEQGLGACWVQLHLRFDASGRDAEDNARELLELPPNERIVGFLALGVRA